MPLSEAVAIIAAELCPPDLEIGGPLLVGDFLLEGRRTDLSQRITAQLSRELVRCRPDLTVLAHHELDAVLERQRLQIEDPFLREQEPAAGQLLPATFLVTGFLFPQGDRGVWVEVRLIHLAHGSVLSAAGAFLAGCQPREVDDDGTLPLEVSFRVTARERGREGEFLVQEGSELYSGDLLRVRVKPNRPAHLYLVLLDSQDGVRLLFPPEPEAASLVAGAELLVPGDGEFFRLDRQPGLESLLVVASLEKVSSLQLLLERLDEAATARGTGELGDEVLGLVQELGRRGFVGLSDPAGGGREGLGEVMRSYSGTVWRLLTFVHKK